MRLIIFCGLFKAYPGFHLLKNIDLPVFYKSEADRWTNARTESLSYESVTNRRNDRLTDGRMDGRTHQRMNGRTDPLAERLRLRLQISPLHGDFPQMTPSMIRS